MKLPLYFQNVDLYLVLETFKTPTRAAKLVLFANNRSTGT